MAFTYNITANTADSQQVTPYWLAMVLPFAHKITYNFDPSNPKSKDIDALETNPPIFLDNQIVAWGTSSSKGTPSAGLQMTLKYLGTDYSKTLTNGDWILFWAFDNYDDYITIKRRLSQTPPERANEFARAPKFIGRITSVMKGFAVVGKTGHKRLTFNVSCNGFTEFTSKIYHHPQLKIPNLPVNLAWSRFSEKADLLKGYAEPMDSIPTLLQIMLGVGPGDAFKGDSDVRTSPNDAFKIPSIIGNILLSSSSTKSPLYYSDIVRSMVGTQIYNDLGRFEPDLFRLKGQVACNPLNFNNQTIWSILSSYAATPINELFTCLRVNSAGYVVPTLVCRQTPLCSKAFKELNSQFATSDTTSFLELPRWQIDDSMILAANLGSSDAVRVNYLQYFGYHVGNQAVSEARLFNLFTPIVDVQDINRNGLQTDIREVPILYIPGNADNGDNEQQRSSKELGEYLNGLMADIKMDGHLKFAGTVVSKGIQAPICEGDNLVFDGGIYHIERVAHSGSVDAGGNREFTTTLTLTNGISIKSDDTLAHGVSIRTDEDNPINASQAFRNIYLTDDLNEDEEDISLKVGLDFEFEDNK